MTQCGVKTDHPLMKSSRRKIKDPGASLMAQLVKNPPATAGDARDTSSIPESGRSPGEGNGNQYSCLENSIDGGAWQVTVHEVPKNQA